MTKAIIATLALATTVVFAGPAFAEKFKAALDGKSEVPPNASTGTGTADIDYDPASKKLSWKLTYTGLSGPRRPPTSMVRPSPARMPGVEVAIPGATSSPAEGTATLTDAHAADLQGRQALHQRPHRGQPGRRNPRPGNEVTGTKQLLTQRFLVPAVANKKG